MAGPRFLSVLTMINSSLERRCFMAWDCMLVILVERLRVSIFLLISCVRRVLNWFRRISISGLACGGCQVLFFM